MELFTLCDMKSLVFYAQVCFSYFLFLHLRLANGHWRWSATLDRFSSPTTSRSVSNS